MGHEEEEYVADQIQGACLLAPWTHPFPGAELKVRTQKGSQWGLVGKIMCIYPRDLGSRPGAREEERRREACDACVMCVRDVRLYRVCCVHCMIVCISTSTRFVRVLRVPW